MTKMIILKCTVWEFRHVVYDFSTSKSWLWTELWSKPLVILDNGKSSCVWRLFESFKSISSHQYGSIGFVFEYVQIIRSSSRHNLKHNFNKVLRYLTCPFVFNYLKLTSRCPFSVQKFAVAFHEFACLHLQCVTYPDTFCWVTAPCYTHFSTLFTTLYQHHTLPVPPFCVHIPQWLAL